jgi:hypothetical protein
MVVPCLSRVRVAALGALFVTASTLPAFAVCPVCDGAVRFDTALGTCFQQSVEEELKRLESEGRGFVIVDLADCAKGFRTALPTDPDKRAASLDESFVADADGLRCLRQAIGENTAGLNPAVLFDLTKICS